MNEPRYFSLSELHRYNGDFGYPMYVAYRGVVYDVSNCPKWKSGLHENLHFPGQDLTDALDEDSPHGQSVFKHPCLKQVGMLAG